MDNANTTAAASKVSPNNKGEATVRVTARAPLTSGANGVIIRVTFKAGGVMVRAISGANRA